MALVALLFLGGSIEGRSRLVGDSFQDLELPRTGYPPCLDGEGTHCPTPAPTIDPTMAARGVALRIPRLEIPIDHVGNYSIPVGSALVPNGVLTDASMTMPGGPNADIALPDGVIRLVVLGEDGTPFADPYEDGWHAGLETVTASIRFDVRTIYAPTQLVLEDIVVR